MNYDSIILEMLSRIQALEEKVTALEEMVNGQEESAAAPAVRGGEKISTGDIRAYIRARLESAAAAGERELILRAGEIHRAMKLVQRMPQVCNAMRQCMGEGDRVLFETPSGYSSTLEIQYNLRDPDSLEAYD